MPTLEREQEEQRRESLTSGSNHLPLFLWPCRADRALLGKERRRELSDFLELIVHFYGQPYPRTKMTSVHKDKERVTTSSTQRTHLFSSSFSESSRPDAKMSRVRFPHIWRSGFKGGSEEVMGK